ncbi:oligosaccharide flippase family protein [Chryseobacterium gleum]|uniref:lipopolysaccharide biosynthesis protein n=1 Tax=Chryseobacterium gleum TaxID=250 RepID=UPI001E54EE64|nr:oligosaccharide flippase family protein [Chryseobacterium gleum]MCE4066096.1 oligosaccharide flippase family protein [Chryseobacterium gleum]
MKERLKEISRNKFIRNVSTLALGSIVSQAIVVASSPLLSRIYSVEAFGNLSIFTSFTVFFAVLATGRYELAIGLPDCDKKALKVFKLIICFGFIVSSIYLILIFLLKEVFHIHDRTGFLNQNEAYIAPLYIFFIALYTALGYWKQRKKEYAKITIGNAIQVVSTTVFSLLLGLLNCGNGMILGLVFGVILSSMYLFKTENNLFTSIFQQKNIKDIAKEYFSFPRYMIFSDLSLAASQQFIPILFSLLYNTTVVGFFSMANRILRLPNIVITSSITNVFRNDVIDELRQNGNCRQLYISTFKKLVFISFPIYTAIFILSPTVFEFVFGKQWIEAGYFARILSVLLVVEFVVTPLNSIFYIVGKQKLFMRIQVLASVVGMIMIYIGKVIFKTPYLSLILFCINSLVFNIVFLLSSYHLSKKGL